MQPAALGFDPVAQLRLFDPHEARALEFVQVGNLAKAKRIRECWRNPLNPRKNVYGNPGCGDRQCPSCAALDAKKKGYKARGYIERMGQHQHWVAHVYSPTCPSGDVVAMTKALDLAVTELTQAMGTLKRRVAFKRSVAGGVGSMEVKFQSKWSRWDVHYHLVLDTDDLNATRVDDLWKSLVQAGCFSRDPSKDPRSPSEIQRLAFYITKTRDWTPDPSEGTPVEMEARARALKGKQRLTHWGSARAPKKAP